MPTASNRDKSSKAGKKLGGSRAASNETPVSSKEKKSPAKSNTGNTKETRPASKAPAGKPVTASGKTSAKAEPKAPAGDHTEATGRDHPSQSEHAHRLFEKLHGTSAQRGNVPGRAAPGKKGGFDPHQFRGGQKGGFGGGNMIRRTQSRGGGSSGGGGGGSA